jgi:hypothetical protein
MVKTYLSKGYKILSNPEKAFSDLRNDSLETVVSFYIKMLTLMSVAAAIANIIYSLARAVYLDIAMNTDITYSRMINYTIGSSTSLAFLYIFLGTFLVFIVSSLLSVFIRKLRYLELLKVVLYSVTPILMLGWIPFVAVPLLVWCGFLFVTGIKSYSSTKIRKGSINQRY